MALVTDLTLHLGRDEATGTLIGLSKPLTELTVDDLLDETIVTVGAIDKRIEVATLWNNETGIQVATYAPPAVPMRSDRKNSYCGYYFDTNDNNLCKSCGSENEAHNGIYIRSMFALVSGSFQGNCGDEDSIDITKNIRLVTELDVSKVYLNTYIKTYSGHDATHDDPLNDRALTRYLNVRDRETGYGIVEVDYSTMQISPVWLIVIDGNPVILPGGLCYYYWNYGDVFLYGNGISNGIKSFDRQYSFGFDPLIKATDGEYLFDEPSQLQDLEYDYGGRYENYKIWYSAYNRWPYYWTLQLAQTIQMMLDAASWAGLYFKFDNVMYKPIIKDGIVTGYTDDLTTESEIDNWTTINDHNIPVTPPGPDPSSQDEESEYRGAAWAGSDNVSVNTGISYRFMTDDDINEFRSIIARLKNFSLSHIQYWERSLVLDIDESTAEKYWKETFPTPAEYAASIYDKYGYGSDPINSIISITAFPFEIPNGAKKSINNIGREDLYISIPIGETWSGQIDYTNIEYYFKGSDFPADKYTYPAVTSNAFTKHVCSHVIKHPKDYKDFRAYAPYTRLELYIPMHGTIDLDPAVVIGKDLTVNISVTVADGSSVATVLINGSIYQTVNGQVGYSIPLSAEASSTNNLALKTISAQGQSQRLNAVGNLIHGLTSVAGSIASGNYGAAAGSAIDTIMTGQQNVIANQTIKYQIEHATDGKIVVGQPTSLNAFLVHPKCQLIWHLPLMQGFDQAVYGKTVGYKCHKTATLGSLSGYTECSNAVLDGVSCTEAEKAIILEKLKSGIII